MIGNFFKSLFEAIGDIAEGIFSVFATVADAVIGLAIFPLASLFGALVNVLSNGICGLMQLIASGTIGLFALDIGTGRSVFETVIGGVGWIWPVMRTMGLAVVFFIFLTNILKIMTASNPPETPWSLLASTIMAGICVVAGPTLVIYFMKMFNAFFEFAVGVNNFSALDFTNFASAAQMYVQGGALDIGLGAQLTSLVTAFLYLYLLLMIARMFISFMLEVAQRYVVLGALIVTSPVAFALFTSKSTRGSFTSWVRMIGSQLFLMVANAVFLSIFFMAFGSFSTTLDKMQETEIAAGTAPLVVVILWCLLLYSLLYVGTKFDIYLGSLGLSTAETGSSAITQLAAELFDIGAFQGFFLSKTGRNSAGRSGAEPMPRGVAGVVDRVQRAMGVGSYRVPAAKQTIQFDQTYSATPDSINKAVKTMPLNDSSSGAHIGRGVISGMKGLPSKIKDRFDPNSCTVSFGCIKMDSFTDAQGKGFSVTFMPKADLTENSTVMGCGRTVSIGGEEYVAFATGSDARAFNVANSGFKKAVSDTYGSGEVRQVFEGKVPTGIYQRKADGPNGAVIHQWAPVSCYKVDPALSPSIVHIGKLDYWSYDVPLPEPDGMSGYGGLCEKPHMPPEPSDRVEWMQTQFPNGQSAGFTPVRQENGVTYIEQAGRKYAMAPTAIYEVAMMGDTAKELEQQVWTASNGALYTVVGLREDDTRGEHFKARDTSGGLPYVQEVKFTDLFEKSTVTIDVAGVRVSGGDHPLSEAEVAEIMREAAPEIIKAAMEKTAKKSDRTGGK